IFDQPVRDSGEDAVKQEQIISFQHPDHDTENWPAKGLHL
ncbi:GFA family protein, partial [Neorhizobium galegae]|nr:GFA family protein [Neorhizobium galegae]MCQ1800175.1 GFA family protein [Neorhizobium galegae]